MGGWFPQGTEGAGLTSSGLKFRIGSSVAGQILTRLWRRYAADRRRATFYPALEKGTIDAAEWVGPYDDEKLGFNKIAPVSTTTPGWWEGGAMLHNMINIDKWNSLTPDLSVGHPLRLRLRSWCGCRRSTTR